MRSGLRDRIWAASGAIVLQLLLAIGLILGLRVRLPDRPAVEPALIVDIPTPLPVRQPEPKRSGERAPEAPAPANLRARATDIIAAPPVIDLPAPIIAVPIADVGMQGNSGASEQPGIGTGAGGWGNGRGGGGDGYGGTPPRRLRGSLRNSDYPRGAAEAGAGGTVGVRYRVGIDGRVSGCLITRSSGSAELDDATCALIERRFRFAPARDEDGRPVSSTIVENHSWFVEQDEPEQP